MSWVSITVYSLLGLSVLVFILGYIYSKFKQRKTKQAFEKKLQTFNSNNSNQITFKEFEQPQDLLKPRVATMEEKISARFNFSKAAKEFKLIQKVTPIGTLMRFGDKFHAAVIEDKGKLWLENKDYGFFVEKPDDRSLCIIDNQEGFLYKQLNNQWLLQGYNLANGQNNNIYTIDEQSDFLRTLEAKFWQYLGRNKMDKDKWSFWGLVVLGLLIVFALSINVYTTNKYQSNVNELLDGKALDDTDKKLLLQIIQNQDKITNENLELITTIKNKELNINRPPNNEEGIIFK